MSSWRHRGWRITRSIYDPGDYTAKRGDESREFPHHWGLAGVRHELDALIADEEEAERTERMLAEQRRRRDLEDAERERLWLSRLPSTRCPKCGAVVVEARTEAGARIPLDASPNPSGDWTAVACDPSTRTPIVRRSASEPNADRYEVHASVCPARPAMAEPSGQLRLRFRKNLLDRRPRARRRPAHRQMFLTLSHQAEQLEFPNQGQ